MKNMTLKAITAACGGTYFGDEASAEKEVSSVVIDSRKVKKDSLFVAIRGARVDGHNFIWQTIDAGALCALSEKNLGDVSFPYILVESCTQALRDLAEHYRRSLDIKVVGITGSVGKTSTKEMIASVLEQKYNVLKTAGNFNNEIGVPLTIFNIREEHEIAVLEMGINHFGEMTRLTKMARPDICVITNIGVAHMELLGSRDGILKAKTEIFQYMNPEGTIILNGDDDKLITCVPENGIKPIYFGLQDSTSYHAEQIESKGLRGTDATFITPKSKFTAHISIPGEHMVHNALAGIAVGYALGMNDDEIKTGIEALKPLAGRNHLIETDTYTIIDDCYNANPISMKASIDVLANAGTQNSPPDCLTACTAARTVAILGDMGELGAQEKEMHYDVGSHTAKAGINALVCIGTLSAEIARGAAETTDISSKNRIELYHYEDKTAFFANMDNILQKGDTILVKASHAMGFEEIVEKLKK